MKETFKIGTIGIDVVDVGVLIRDTRNEVEGLVVFEPNRTTIRLSDLGNEAIQNFMTLLGDDYVKYLKKTEKEERVALLGGLMESSYTEEGKRGLFMKLIIDIQALIRKLNEDGLLGCYLGVADGLTMESYVLNGEIGHTQYAVYREVSEIPKGTRTIRIELGKKMVFTTEDVAKILGF